MSHTQKLQEHLTSTLELSERAQEQIWGFVYNHWPNIFHCVGVLVTECSLHYLVWQQTPYAVWRLEKEHIEWRNTFVNMFLPSQNISATLKLQCCDNVIPKCNYCINPNSHTTATVAAWPLYIMLQRITHSSTDQKREITVITCCLVYCTLP